MITLVSYMRVIGQNDLPRLYFRGGGNLTFAMFGGSYGPAMFMPSLNLTPGLRIAQGTDFALAVTMPISWGKATNDFWISYSEYGVDLPLMVEFDFGSATGNSRTNRAGFTVGAGIGWLYMGEFPYIDSQNIARTESLQILGYRFNMGYSFGKDPTGDRTMIMMNFGGSPIYQRYTFSIGLYFIFGNRKN
jgi:hypothetical protein